MEEMTSILRSCWLFQGWTDTELEQVLHCIPSRRQSYRKGEILFHTGDSFSQAGILLQGVLHIFREDFWGNQMILSDCGPGDVFGEVFACLPDSTTDVSVRAVSDSQVVYLDVPHLLTVCPNACPFHSRLIRNFITVLAQKNRTLSRKIHHLTQRGIRGKLLSYLSEQSALLGKTTFSIPYNRQQLADYLSVDRSALSAELGRLQQEGILSFHKNVFTLTQRD